MSNSAFSALPLVIGWAVVLATMGIDGILEMQVGDGLCHAIGGRLHQSGVKSAADGKRDHPLGALLLGQLRGLVHHLAGSADGYLARAVDVGDLHAGGLADALDTGLIQPDDGQHAARGLIPGLLHQAPPLAGQPEGVGEAQCAGRYESRVLAQAMSRQKRWLRPVLKLGLVLK